MFSQLPSASRREGETLLREQVRLTSVYSFTITIHSQADLRWELKIHCLGDHMLCAIFAYLDNYHFFFKLYITYEREYYIAAQPSISGELRGVWKCDETTLSRVFNISFQSKVKVR